MTTPPATVRSAIADLTARFAAASLESPRLDARVLVAHVLQIDSAQTFMQGDTTLSIQQQELLNGYAARRLGHEPISRILGRREFWGLSFMVTPDTLDPRADTETVVSAVIDHVKRLDLSHGQLLDLGTGTGCLALSLLHELPHWTAVAVDRSRAALDVARHNAQQLGLINRIQFVESDWATNVTNRFSVVVSNPPYLSAADMSTLAPEVRYDPQLALAAGADGLECYRTIIGDVNRIAARPCIVALEVGQGQAEAVADLLQQQGARVVEIRADLASVPRCVVAEIQVKKS